LNVSELNSSEYHPYYEPYIKVLGNANLIDALETGLNTITGFIKNIPEDKMAYAYADGKWSVAEVLVHLMDTERIFQYRALRFARNDKTELKGFEQDDYIPESEANGRDKEELLREFLAIRNSSIALFKSFREEKLKRSGKANGATMSVRALGCIICGHQAHHFNILKERYLQ
jgi:hypothetical protein